MAGELETSELQLMRAMGLTDENIARRRAFVALGPEDVERISRLRQSLVGRAEEFAGVFFGALTKLEEARGLTGRRELLEEARKLKIEHLVQMFQGDYGPAYVQQRMKLAQLYAKVGLEPSVFLGAFQHMLRAIGEAAARLSERGPAEGVEAYGSLQKVTFFDVGLIVDAMVFERERVIRQQQAAIRELSTPVLQIRDRMLLLPIIGVVDTHRARLVTEGLLRAIRQNRAKVVVMDVTGVATIDSKVANHLLQTVAAARLMGATVIVSGLSSEVAQSLVALGIELGTLNTVGDLQGGVEDAERLLGYRVTQVDPVTMTA